MSLLDSFDAGSFLRFLAGFDDTVSHDLSMSSPSELTSVAPSMKHTSVARGTCTGWAKKTGPFLKVYKNGPVFWPTLYNYSVYS